MKLYSNSLPISFFPNSISCFSILFVPSSQSSMKVKVTQSCLTLCDPKNYTVYGILQARILEWVAFPFSRGSFQPRDRTQVSHFAGRFFTSWATVRLAVINNSMVSDGQGSLACYSPWDHRVRHNWVTELNDNISWLLVFSVFLFLSPFL